MNKALLAIGIALVSLAGTAAGILLGPIQALIVGAVGGAVLAVACWVSCHPRASQLSE